ncbi:hypothetical protein VP758_004973 [Vibrio harveyi]|nr:hypothetical protein [Vibrio harveyi]
MKLRLFTILLTLICCPIAFSQMISNTIQLTAVVNNSIVNVNALNVEIIDYMHKFLSYDKKNRMFNPINFKFRVKSSKILDNIYIYPMEKSFVCALDGNDTNNQSFKITELTTNAKEDPITGVIDVSNRNGWKEYTSLSSPEYKYYNDLALKIDFSPFDKDYIGSCLGTLTVIVTSSIL